MKFTVPDIKRLKQMVSYSNSDDEKELSKNLHKEQPYFCNLIDELSYDPRCFEVHKFCTLFCGVASEKAQLILNEEYEEYIKIPEQYFDTMKHLIAQKNPVIGKRGFTYPSRIEKHVLKNTTFDDVDREWLLITIPAFLYTIESFYNSTNPERFFSLLYNEL